MLPNTSAHPHVNEILSAPQTAITQVVVAERGLWPGSCFSDRLSGVFRAGLAAQVSPRARSITLAEPAAPIPVSEGDKRGADVGEVAWPTQQESHLIPARYWS